MCLSPNARKEFVLLPSIIVLRPKTLDLNNNNNNNNNNNFLFSR